MAELEEINDKVERAVEEVNQFIADKNVMLGWDGFVDNIWELVKERESVTDYEVMNSMLTLSDRIQEVAGGGLSTEIIQKDQRAGGFTANTGRVLGNLKVDTTLVALFGAQQTVPVFADLAETMEVVSLGDPCISHIFEFDDGKLMFPANQNVRSMDWQEIKEKVGLEKLIEVMEQADLIGLGYWANMPYYDQICTGILEEVAPKLSFKRRQMFMDFGNVKKRSDQDLQATCARLAELEEHFELTVSFNRTEMLDTAQALGVISEPNPEDIAAALTRMREKIGISNLVLHTNKFACSSTQQGVERLPQPYCEQPVVTTGAGDTFNGGYIFGLLCSDDPAVRLAIASGTAGYFIRNGEPPAEEELLQFLTDYPNYFK